MEERDIHCNLNIIVNWENTYRLSFLCTREAKLRAFQFKFLHRKIATNDFLHKIDIKQTDSCSFCEEPKETLAHLFWTCKYTYKFWKSMFEWIKDFKNVPPFLSLCCGLMDDFKGLLFLSDKPLSAVDHHKHLGVWLESSLSWDYHINYICAKANKVLSLIRRTFGSNNPEGVSTAYKTLVRPILEYGCQVWNPYLVKHIKSIESIQRRATRVICGSEKEYQERLGVLKWPSLELRRKFICLVQMYKIIFGHCDIDPHMFFDFNVLAKTRKNHNFKIRPKKTRTNYFKFSFFNRYITDWNSIPTNITHASSLSSFKSHLLDHLCHLNQE